MSFTATIVDGSGAARWVEARGAERVEDAREVRINAQADEVSLCRRGDDLVADFENGDMLRLMGFFKGDGATPGFHLQAPGEESSFIQYVVPQDQESCRGLLVPLPAGDETLGKFVVPLGIASAFAGGLGAAFLGSGERNAPPAFGSGVVAGDVKELSDGAPGQNMAILTAEGEIAFFDKNKKDVHKVVARLVSAEDSVIGHVEGYGTFTPVIVQKRGGGTVKWQFAVPDAALQSLAEGQSATQIYELTVTDGGGDSAKKLVTVTITGSNDAPVITGGETQGQVTERPDGAADENAVTHETSGTLTFTDADLIDTHEVTARLVSAEDSVNGEVAARGTFTPEIVEGATGGATGRIAWRFSVEDASIDDLAEGQTITQVYEITVSDGNGGTATERVTVTINGSNDAPVAQPLSAEMNEYDQPITIVADFTDVDLADTHEIFIDTTGTRGLVTDNGDGTFTYTVRDSAGAESTQTVTVTVIGENDPPVVPDVTLQANEQTNMAFSDEPSFAGWTVRETLQGYEGTTSATVDRSGTIIPGQDAVAALTLSGTVPSGYGTGWGASIVSAPFVARAGNMVEIEYLAIPGGDDIYGVGRILNARTGELVQTLFNEHVHWQNPPNVPKTVQAKVQHTGEFVFEFQVGSYDATGGRYIGATLYVGHALIESDLLANSRDYTFEASDFLANAHDPNGDPLAIVSVSATSARGAAVTLGADGRIHYDPKTALATLAPGDLPRVISSSLD